MFATAVAAAAGSAPAASFAAPTMRRSGGGERASLVGLLPGRGILYGLAAAEMERRADQFLVPPDTYRARPILGPQAWI